MSASLRAPERFEIDPLARVGPKVQLEPPAQIEAGAVLQGLVRAGAGLIVHPGASIGSSAQHRQRGQGRIDIGRGVEIWECATIHAGSAVGTGTTRVGDRVMVMAYAHLGHDVEVADDVVISNGAQIGGHVRLAADSVIGARAAIHQFVRVGRGAMIAAGALVSSDVPPWSLVAGDRARILGPNRVALGSQDRCSRVRKALRLLGTPGLCGNDLLDELGHEHSEVQDLASFVDAASSRGMCRWGARS